MDCLLVLLIEVECLEVASAIKAWKLLHKWYITFLDMVDLSVGAKQSNCLEFVEEHPYVLKPCAIGSKAGEAIVVKRESIAIHANVHDKGLVSHQKRHQRRIFEPPNTLYQLNFWSKWEEGKVRKTDSLIYLGECLPRELNISLSTEKGEAPVIHWFCS